MPQSEDRAPDGALLRLSLPAASDLRVIVVDVAKRVAEYLRDRAPDGQSVTAAVERLTAHVAPASADGEITFDFREINGELQIEAHCGSRSSEVRCPLPA